MQSKPIAKLVELQVKGELTDREMAERLGCSRQLWQMTRSGRIPLGKTMAKCITRNFPELNRDIIYFLAQSVDRLSRDGAENPLSQPSGPQGRGLKRFCVGLVGRIKERLSLEKK